KYEALSYEWGDAKTTWAIVLNGKRKLIRENLYQALLHLRNQDTIRTLWIDALSINQCDIQERNQQVQEMHRIYSRASIVLIWLGLENDTTGPAFDLLKRGGVRNFRGSVLKMVDSARAEYSESQWEALADLCDRPYWNRVWIVQEI
ncbi:heterokaryon incompatibility, partial [Cadophora sp. DSE1049]